MTIQQERDIAVQALEIIAKNEALPAKPWMYAKDAIAAISAQASPVAQDERRRISWGEVWKVLDAVMPSLARFPQITALSKASKEEFALSIMAQDRAGRASVAVPAMTVEPAPVLWWREGATEPMHNICFEKPDAGPWTALGRIVPAAPVVKESLTVEPAAQPVGILPDESPDYHRGWKDGYKHGAWIAQPVGDTVEDYDAMLRELCCFLSVGGYNSEGLMSAATANEKIRWGIDHLVATECERAKKGAQPVGEAVAWMHDTDGRVDVIHDKVKQLWLKVGQPTGFYREKVPCKVEHYTIPLYRGAPPVAQDQEAARYRYLKNWWMNEESDTRQLPAIVEIYLDDLCLDEAIDAAIQMQVKKLAK